MILEKHRDGDLECVFLHRSRREVTAPEGYARYFTSLVSGEFPGTTAPAKTASAVVYIIESPYRTGTLTVLRSFQNLIITLRKLTRKILLRTIEN